MTLSGTFTFRGPREIVWELLQDPDVLVTVMPGAERLESFVAPDNLPSPTCAPLRDDAPRVILFTSGTTGEPKAAILRHANLTSYVISTVDFMGSEEGEAALVSVPPYHIAGISALLTGCYSGRRIVHWSATS